MNDIEIGHWIIDIPYIFKKTTSLSTSKRYYFIHENVKVYDENGNNLELYRLLNSRKRMKIYLVNPKVGSWCINYFMVLNPYSHLFLHEDIRMNGKSYFGSNVDRELSLYSYFIQNSTTFLYAPDIIFDATTEKIISEKDPEKFFKKNTIMPWKSDYNKFKNKSKQEWNRIKNRNFKKKYPPRKYLDYNVELTPDFPRQIWSKKVKPKPENVHWGQVKLLISEIDFFINIPTLKEKGGIVVYAGAAGGFHIPFLTKMFPNLLFILYDPANFGIDPTSNIIIRQEYFTDEIARLYSNIPNIYFISDIRLDAPNEENFEKMVWLNNQMNKKWISIIKPVSSMLKFRFPFIKPYTRTFLNGNIRFQVFAPTTSAETRLIPFGEQSLKKYDTKIYEEQMTYFNHNYRNRSFLDLDPIYGINYDTYRTYDVLHNFLISRGQKFSSNIHRWNAVASIINEIEMTLGKNTISRILR